MVTALKKEIIKSQNDTGLGANEKNAEYRQMLVQSVHACAVKFPDVAGSVVHMLMDFLGDPNTGVPALMDYVHSQIAQKRIAVCASRFYRDC